MSEKLLPLVAGCLAITIPDGQTVRCLQLLQPKESYTSAETGKRCWNERDEPVWLCEGMPLIHCHRITRPDENIMMRFAHCAPDILMRIDGDTGYFMAEQRIEEDQQEGKQ